MYLSIDELEVKIRVGKGIAAIVEGESDEDDAWFYGYWFGNLASQITFFPQNGWSKVVSAVQELRHRCPKNPVVGIIDRDFAPSDQLETDLATHGILRTRYFTLENYLLEPEGWANVMALIFRRGAPDGWDDATCVQKYIEDCYRDCLPLAAYNRVIKFGCTKYEQQALLTPKRQRVYKTHLKGLESIDPVSKLREWGTRLGAEEDLAQLFKQHLHRLSKSSFNIWQQEVSGKYVFAHLHSLFPLPPRKKRFDRYHYLNLYMVCYPTPPSDLVNMIAKIFAAYAPDG